jgi:hypothetical protein
MGGVGAPSRLTDSGDGLGIDIPLCIEGIDIGIEPTPLQRAEFPAARTWGARRTWFLSTARRRPATSPASRSPTGGRIVVQRNVDPTATAASSTLNHQRHDVEKPRPAPLTR